MSPCDSCHAGCCRSFAVPITGADILRIAGELGLTFWDFACRWADKDGRIARNHAPHFHFRDEPETPFVICLAHESSQFFPETTRCRFLVEGQPDAGSPLGQARCGIYRQRPSACRAFPAKLNDSSDLAIVYDVPDRSRDEDHPAYQLCPRQWEAKDLEPVRTVQDLVVARYEMAFFTHLAQLWNRTPGAWTVFPDFLRTVYTNRVTREVETDDQAVVLPMPNVDGSNARTTRAA